MHIPDGFLSAPVWVTLDVVSVPAVGYMARKAQCGIDESRIPLLGVMGAFVFAAQMINFPVGLGTSGHLLGSALLAFTLGPAAAAVVMTAILAIQALIFQDGGVLALGANVFNMAIAGVLAGYLPYHLFGTGKMRKPSMFAGAVLSVLAGACLAVAQLRVSGIPIEGRILGVSLVLFAATALLEGAITLAVVGSIEALNPGWLRETRSPPKALAVLAAAALFLSVAGVMVASASPDVLENLAGKAGIADRARALLATPLADYEVRSFDSPWLRKASAGIAGLAMIYAACVLIGRLASRRRRV